jgi:lipopolysaccharide export system protein LptA
MGAVTGPAAAVGASVVTVVLACALLAGAAVGPAAAQGAPHTMSLAGEGGPLTVTADEMSFSNQTGHLGFTGKVQVERGGMRMRAERLTVTLQPASDVGQKRAIDRMVAEGEVTFTYGERTATAGRAEFDPGAETVVLTETPTVTDPGMSVVGRRITIDLATQESTVEGGAFTFTEGR